MSKGDLPFDSSNLGNKKIKRCLPATNENRTGLVFESGLDHFDRHNKLHKERPSRIQAVEDYLKNIKKMDGEKSLPDRCQLLKSCGWFQDDVDEKSEGLWLSDYDYLRVHLPGYMQL